MGQKIKPRQQRKPRNQIALQMFLDAKGGPMRDRRERRPKDAKRHWSREWDENG